MREKFLGFVSAGLFGIVQRALELTDGAFMLCLFGFVLLDAAAGYFLGSINPAIIVSKRIYGGDIRNFGSGNAGMTNMFRVYGKKAGLLTLLGDFLKTVLATLVGYALFGNLPFVILKGELAFYGRFGAYLAGLFCVLGHLFPAYYQFRGGKGVLVTAVVLLMTDWPVLLVSLVIFAIVLIGTKMVSLSSVMSALMMPLLLRIWYKSLNYASDANVNGGMSLAIMVFIAVLIVIKHIPNLRRVREGTESKIRLPWEKKEGSAEAAKLPGNGSGIKNPNTSKKKIKAREKNESLSKKDD